MFFVEGFGTIFFIGSVVFIVISSVRYLIFDFFNSFLNLQESLLSPNSTTFIAFGSLALLQAFIPCYFGNEIKISTAQFLDCIEYESWINSDDKKNFIILQECLKKNVKVRAAELFSIDLDSFLAIIKAAYSVFTFFRR